MVKKDVSEAVITVGDLRQRLKALGEPWVVSPHLGNDDPIPQQARGGTSEAVAPPRELKSINSLADFEALVHSTPPANPLLAQRWVELGITASTAASTLNLPGTEENTDEWGVA